MNVLIGNSVDPYFNLAMEEYFLKEKSEDFFMLWRNDKSVIIGKNQNAYAEINQKFVDDNNIKVVRRMTGGGAVFHDLGNVNYTFIRRNSKDSFNDYAVFSKPVINYLNTLGIEAYLSGRNDMMIGDFKFSGNAQCAYKNSVMHHGTLLFSSEKSDISGALNVNPLKIKSKGIASVKSRVTNISDHLNSHMDVESFIDGLYSYILNNFENTMKYELTDSDYKAIKELADKKYSDVSWNYGFKQEFSIINEQKFKSGIVQINLSILDNKINKIKIYGDFFGVRDISELERVLEGVLYYRDKISEALELVKLDDYISGIEDKAFLDLFFS